ncbi:MAG TPA: hypothetical protein VK919_09330 [Solirubrobacterales bacterium]|nr:hypothetical protein [Solirubrobacterales bacterium]
MDLARLGRGELIAAGSGAGLIAIMFLPWWGASLQGVPLGEVAGVDNRTANAWEAATFNDVIWFVAGLAAIALAIVTATQRRSGVSVAGSALLTALGLLALVLIVVRLVDPPGALGREYGAWLGLAAIVGIVCGGWLAMRDEGTSLGEQAHRLEDRAAGAGPTSQASHPPSDRGTSV